MYQFFELLNIVLHPDNLRDHLAQHQKYPYLNQTHGFQVNDFGSIVAAACLAHDIGNPPFGHSGESSIVDFFKIGDGQKYKSELTKVQYNDLCNFEGNANGFKILTETKIGSPGGLRLSYATLGAFTKYPKAGKSSPMNIVSCVHV